MTADQMVAYALEAPVELLPFLPELLADLEELGSDAARVTAVVRDLALPPSARAVDLGCGKGATVIALAATLGLHAVGVDLFEPFVTHAGAAARAAGLDHLCAFHQGDAGTPLAGAPPFDLAIVAALGDVLGDPAETMRALRQHVRPGGYVLISDVCLRPGGATAFEGFEHYRSREETVRGLTAWGDALVREVVEPETAGNAGHEDDDAVAIARRAMALAVQHPEQREALLAFADYQARATTHIDENLEDVVWVLQRVDAGASPHR